MKKINNLTLLMFLATVSNCFGQLLITNQHATQATAPGATVTFQVGASSLEPLAYQWQKNPGNGFSDLADRTNAALVLASVQPWDACDYRVVVTNITGARTSAVARLYVMRTALVTTNVVIDNFDDNQLTGWRSSGGYRQVQLTESNQQLDVLTGSIGNKGGTSMTGWNKFVPKPFKGAPAPENWNELHYPIEYPLAHYEMSAVAPYAGRGPRQYRRLLSGFTTRCGSIQMVSCGSRRSRMNPRSSAMLLSRPPGMRPPGLPIMSCPPHGPERHDLMSQETHAGQWIAFRQPVRRVAMERAGIKVDFTYQANPGEVWEENEFWIQLSARMDPDGSLGVRQWFESPYRKGEIITRSMNTTSGSSKIPYRDCQRPPPGKD